MVDLGVQLHGGAGYMSEYEISKMYTDARVSRIYAGSSEIMKLIIGRDIFSDKYVSPLVQDLASSISSRNRSFKSKSELVSGFGVLLEGISSCDNSFS